jgi:hypothetical protein
MVIYVARKVKWLLATCSVEKDTLKNVDMNIVLIDFAFKKYARRSYLF